MENNEEKTVKTERRDFEIGYCEGYSRNLPNRYLSEDYESGYRIGRKDYREEKI